MPIYEYSCNSCGYHFEAMQKVTEDPLLKCPECEKNTLIKLVSAAAFRLKGGGWYETDFKEGDKKKNLVQSEISQETHSESDALKSSESTARKSIEGSDASVSKNNTSSSETTGSDKGSLASKNKTSSDKTSTESKVAPSSNASTNSSSASTNSVSTKKNSE